MQAQAIERVGEHEAHRLGHVPAAVKRRERRVAQVGALQRVAHDVPEREVADDRSVVAMADEIARRSPAAGRGAGRSRTGRGVAGGVTQGWCSIARSPRARDELVAVVVRRGARSVTAPHGCGLRSEPDALAIARVPERQRGWWGQDSNLRRQSQRVYSPSPLTTRTPHLVSMARQRRRSPDSSRWSPARRAERGPPRPSAFDRARR